MSAETAILTALLNGPDHGMTTNQLVAATGFSYTTCKNYLTMFRTSRRPPWIERYGRDAKLAGRPPSGVYFGLSDAGRDVAQALRP